MSTLTQNESDLELALVVGAARSGTTLLRLLLDAHTEIGCPAEAGLPALMSQMARVWMTIEADVLDDGASVDPGRPAPDANGATPKEMTAIQSEPSVARVSVPKPALDWIRNSTLVAMHQYCDRTSKRLYVDKSLDSGHHLGIVRTVFPTARYLLVFRHVMDAIASGLEASPWGFQAYGYHSYVQGSPGNTVAALAHYWVDHVSQALDWEKQYPDSCMRVRYEDLVTNPDALISGVQRFLGVRTDLSVLSAAFDRAPARGPGDYKVEHTSAVHANSIGNGKRVPVDMLPPPLLQIINEKLQALGYEKLDRSWNAAERPVSLRFETVWSNRLRDLMTRAQRPSQGHDAGVFALVAEDHAALRWVVDTEDGAVYDGDGEVDAVLTGTAEDLVLMLTDAENFGVLLRSGRIRHIAPEPSEPTPTSELRRQIDAIVAAARSLVRDADAPDPAPAY